MSMGSYSCSYSYGYIRVRSLAEGMYYIYGVRIRVGAGVP